MAKTIIDRFTYTQHAYTIAALASPFMQEQLSQLQNDLIELLGSSIHIIPSKGLHMTVVELIQSKEYVEASRQSIFQEHEDEYRSIPKEIISKYETQTVRFNKIVASQKAITVQAENTGAFNEIRSELTEALPLPSETKSPPDVLHCSIARFSEEIDVEDVKRIADKFSIDFEERIYRLQLATDLLPPNYNYRVLETFPFEN